ncbi:MAG: hypothetical protein KDB90_04130 [Planctomycetes bacterium]|nr:hypothetical protein [Planctomycetota bacterium]
MPRVLLSGFEPFGDFATNPSWDALVYARDEGMFETGVRLALIPVTYQGAFEAFEKAVVEYEPHAAISFGVYGSAGESGSFREGKNIGDKPAKLYIEATARNRDGAKRADNSGRVQGAEEIVPGAPATLPATFPAELLQQSLQEGGYQAELSHDAGGYLCNHLFYRAAHLFGEGFAYGFVHVPAVDSMGGALSLESLAGAMAIMANTLARTLEDT